MKPRISLREALEDDQLLGKALPGDSWKAWRIMLLACMGEELTPDELAIYTKLTERSASPTERVRQGTFIVGRRGGKTKALSTLAVYLSTLCEHPGLSPGEVGACLLIGMDKDQGALALGYAAATIEQSPLLQQMVKSKTADTITLDNQVEIVVRSPSFRRLRGRTAVCVLGDESSFWYQEGSSANPDTEILAAVRPMLLTTRGPLFLASSPYAKRGILFESWKRDFGPDGDERTVVAKGASQAFNPSLPDAEIKAALERDPEWAKAEYLGMWRDDIESFVCRDAVEACIDPDVRERPFVMGCRYHAFCDPAGGSGGDSMTLAIGHKVGERVLIDAIREIKPPFSPADAVSDFCALMKKYRIATVRGDRYAGAWVSDSFREHGISYRPSEESKSQIYMNFLPQLNTRMVVLLDHMRSVSQIASLERRKRFGGTGESIDHAPRMHDDVANVIAGVAVHAMRGKAEAGERRSAPPKVHLGYAHLKKAGRVVPNRKPNRENGEMSLKHEVMSAGVVETERHPVGDNGHAIELMDRGNDGRTKWRLLDAAGEPLGAVWGQGPATAALEQYIKEGPITR